MSADDGKRTLVKSSAGSSSAKLGGGGKGCGKGAGGASRETSADFRGDEKSHQSAISHPVWFCTARLFLIV